MEQKTSEKAYQTNFTRKIKKKSCKTTKNLFHLGSQSQKSEMKKIVKTVNGGDTSHCCPAIRTEM